MLLTSPDIQSGRVVLADWLELQAVLSPSRRISRSVIDSIFRFTSEDRAIRLQRGLDDQPEDGEIVEAFSEMVVADVLNELEWRTRTIGPGYPFTLCPKRAGLSSTWELVAPQEPLQERWLIYLTCLFLVGYRRDMIVPENPAEAAELSNHKLGMLFQICACLAVGGYIEGEVISFGWPRASGEAFLPALRAAWTRYGAYTVVVTAPVGVSAQIKDGGVDIIAWRHFDDRRPARLLLFGQVASGDDWRDKPVTGAANELTSSWFTGHSPSAWVPATLMPFISHEQVADDVPGNYEQACIDNLLAKGQRHGIIFDRARTVSSAGAALNLGTDQLSRIDGHNRLHELSTWLENFMSNIDSGASA